MRERKLDQFLAAIVLLLFAIIEVVNLVFKLSTLNTPDWLETAVGISKIVIDILVVIVLFYNAWGWSRNILYRLIIIIVALWLVFTNVYPHLPESMQFLGSVL